MDGSFHTPEWHAARLANLNTSHTVTWEEFKRKQKVTVSASPHSSFNVNVFAQKSESVSCLLNCFCAKFLPPLFPI